VPKIIACVFLGFKIKEFSNARQAMLVVNLLNSFLQKHLGSAEVNHYASIEMILAVRQYLSKVR